MRRWYGWAIGALLITIAPYLLLPLVARPFLARTLATALHAPVSIGQLGWKPWTGEVSAERVALGDGADRIAARHVSVGLRVEPLWRGQIVIDRVAIDGLVGTVLLDAQYRPTLVGFGGAGAAASAPPELSIHELVVTNGELTLRYPVHGETRAAPLHVERLESSDVGVTAAGVAMGAQLVGSLDGARVQADAHLQPRADGTQIDTHVALSGWAVSNRTIALPPGLESLRATLDLHATYESAPQPSAQTLRLDVRLADAKLDGSAATALAAKAVVMPDVRIDLAAGRVDLGAVQLDAPTLDIAVTSDGVVLPLAASGAATGSAWTVASQAIELRDGTLRAHRGDSTLSLAVPSARWEGIATGRPTSLALHATADGGGSVAITGTLAADPVEADVAVQLADVRLPPLAELAAPLRLRLAKGTGEGTLHVTDKDGRLRVRGQLRVHDLLTAPPDPERPSEVMAVDTVEAEIGIDADASPPLDVASLTLRYPYVIVQRQPGGTFPFTVFAAADTASSDQTARTPPARLRVERLEVEGGKVEFLDETLTPAYWTSLSSLSARVDELLLPGAAVSRFTITGKQDEISPAELSGSFSDGGWEGRAALQDLRLESINPYVSPLLGYNLTAGRLSANARAVPAPGSLQATAELVLRGVDVKQTGVDFIQNQSGVPLPIALRLITNLKGEIELTLPVTMNTASGHFTLGSIVGQAVRNAIVGALTSPLRILGSLFGSAGAPYAFAIDPIPFDPGSASLARAGAARIGEIAHILQNHGGLVLVAIPQITAADLRAVGPDGAPALARQRAAAVREALLAGDAGQRLAPQRLMQVDWRPPDGPPPTGQSGIYVELQEQP